MGQRPRSGDQAMPVRLETAKQGPKELRHTDAVTLAWTSSKADSATHLPHS